MTAGPPSFPRATLRLQLHKDFGFADATELLPYAASLGVSHIYTSPFLMARAGSLHGYDITDHAHLNPELGEESDFEAFINGLHRNGLGLILDFVPNHMGVGGADNPWWLDVLEWGESSPYSAFFDINWSPNERLRGKVLLPFLGDHYGRVLESGQLELWLDPGHGSFAVWYYEHCFPIAVHDYPRILRRAAARLTEASEEFTALIDAFSRLGGRARSHQRQAAERRAAAEYKAELAALLAGKPALADAVAQAVEDFRPTGGSAGERRQRLEALHDLLERQAYRVAFWRVASDEINYRRFFDINDLAGLRMESQELFEVSHRLVFRWIAEGKLQGLRIDHIDGLFDPVQYCRRIQERAGVLVPGTAAQAESEAGASAAVAGGEALRKLQPIYLLVEKILARHERLRSDWPVDGTTGYDFMNLVNGLFVDPASERPLTQIYHRFLGYAVDFEEVVVAAKRQMIANNLASEFNVMIAQLHGIAQQSWSTRDYTLNGIRAALAEVVAHFPVYRTYINGDGIAADDRRDLDWAFSQGRKASSAADLSVFDFLYAALSTDLLAQAADQGYDRDDILRTAMKFQQLTGPVMAKAFEDTALYRYFRLVSLNEVGGEPTRFGVSPAAFHHLNQERLRNHPFAMLASATHDHKRGEDVRARLNVLSELPQAWARQVRRWSRLNRAKRSLLESGETAPGRNDEYLLYQTLVGVWPAGRSILDGDELAELRDRVSAYMLKAVRESKRRSSWIAPDEAYEAALLHFVHSVLDPERSRAFVNDLSIFQAELAPAGAVNGLAQTALKLTAPGVPDIYQGCEFWDQSLVDPDNRRPVDYDERERTLAALQAGSTTFPDLLRTWPDGRVKQAVAAQLLALRRDRPLLFADGDYLAITPEGDEAERLVAFVRILDSEAVLVVVPRLVAPLLEGTAIPLPPAQRWGETRLPCPPEFIGRKWREVFTGREVCEEGGAFPVSGLLADFPLAVLVS